MFYYSKESNDKYYYWHPVLYPTPISLTYYLYLHFFLRQFCIMNNKKRIRFIKILKAPHSPQQPPIY